jgi:hypothetical protein
MNGMLFSFIIHSLDCTSNNLYSNNVRVPTHPHTGHVDHGHSIVDSSRVHAAYTRSFGPFEGELQSKGGIAGWPGQQVSFRTPNLSVS